MSRNLLRNSRWLVSLLAMTWLTGCHFEARLSTSDDAKKPSKAEEAPKESQPTKTTEAKKKAAKKDDNEKKAAPKDAKTSKPAAAEVSKDAVLLPGNLVFEAGKSTLKEGSGSDEVLGSLKEFLDQQPRVTLLRIEGHSDNAESSSTDSLKLSGDRALTIKQWLIANGVADSRLLAVGFGATKPIADNGSEEGRAQNRRVEFKIAQTSGKNYLGNDPLGGGTEFK